MNRKEKILLTLEDSVADFLYYDRKGDEELSIGEIQAAIKAGEISVDEIVAKFREKLLDQI